MIFVGAGFARAYKNHDGSTNAPRYKSLSIQVPKRKAAKDIAPFDGLEHFNLCWLPVFRLLNLMALPTLHLS
jgi:hypothetical protein